MTERRNQQLKFTEVQEVAVVERALAVVPRSHLILVIHQKTKTKKETTAGITLQRKKGEWVSTNLTN